MPISKKEARLRVAAVEKGDLLEGVVEGFGTVTTKVV